MGLVLDGIPSLWRRLVRIRLRACYGILARASHRCDAGGFVPAHVGACADDRMEWVVVDVTNATATSNMTLVEPGESDRDDDEDSEEDEQEEDEDGTQVDFTGAFSEGQEACESLDGDYVFGAPRTAYENTLLQQAMEVIDTPRLRLRGAFKAWPRSSLKKWTWLAHGSRPLIGCARCYLSRLAPSPQPHGVSEEEM